MNDIIKEILEDHRQFLLLLSDVAGTSISGNAWLRVRSYLSPETKFSIRDPIMMTPEIISKGHVLINKKIRLQ